MADAVMHVPRSLHEGNSHACVEATWFALALLMPRGVVEQIISEHGTGDRAVLRLAVECDVSPAAAELRIDSVARELISAACGMEGDGI